MIIKFIPETEAEKKRFGGAEVVEHTNCKEYFIVGNKMDAEGSIVDFHEWNGGYRYLLGTLNYFYELINDDRRKAFSRDESETPMTFKGQKIMPMIKRGTGGNIQQLDLSKLNFKEQIANEAEGDGIAVEDEFVEEKNSDVVELNVDEVDELVTKKDAKRGLRLI